MYFVKFIAVNCVYFRLGLKVIKIDLKKDIIKCILNSISYIRNAFNHILST